MSQGNCESYKGVEVALEVGASQTKMSSKEPAVGKAVANCNDECSS